MYHNECLVKASVVALLNEVSEVVSLALAESRVLGFLISYLFVKV